MSSTATPTSPGLVIGVLVVINVVVLGTFGAIAWWLLRGRGRRRKILAAAPTTISRLPRAPVAGGSSAAVSAIVGTVAAGPDGPLISPVSGAACAWFRVEILRTTDGAQHLVLAESVAETSSVAEIVVQDMTGSVRVSLAQVQVDNGWLADTRKTSRDPEPGVLFAETTTSERTTGFQQHEYLIPVGATATIVGQLRVDGELLTVMPGTDELAVSPRSLAEWLAANESARVTDRRTAVLLAVVGVVSMVALNALVLFALYG